MRGISEWHFEVYDYDQAKRLVLIDNGIVFGRNLLEIKKITTQISQTQDFKGRWQEASRNLYIKYRNRRKNVSHELDSPYKNPHIRLYKEGA